MSGMAADMAARMREDGRDPATETIDPLAPEGGAAAPGTGGNQPPPADASSAGTLNAETAPAGTEPGPVPYSRFREVNEAYQDLRGYETLREYGYDPDSLSRLATFEAAYVQDPHDTVAKLVDNLDLPDDAKTQIRDLLVSDDGAAPPDGGGTPSTPATPASGSEEPPPWAKPLVDDFTARRTAEAQQREEAMRQEALDQVLSHWTKMDEADGIEAGAREGVKLSLIASYAGSNRFQRPEDLARAARDEWLAEREAALGSSVVRRSTTTGPRSVPGSAAAPSPAQQFGGDIKKATAAARAAMERGELPPITPGG